MKIKTFRDVIGLWPSTSDLAGEIGQKPETVRKWKTRGRIPPEHWDAVIGAAEAHNHRITESDLLRMLCGDRAA